MKVNSVLTKDVDSRGKVLSHSRTTWKRGTKPECSDEQDPFHLEKVEESVNEHISRKDGVDRFVVSISTSKGTFIKTFKAL